ncbi:MAG: histidine triad nucleotide-binding protein [Clostridia bacterium]|nr:histidine triad nucleotide-binding protein [Clostridia bacterium]
MMLKDDCIFCKIIKGEIPSQKVYEDGDMLVFKDIEPKAKVHLLAVPKDHYKLLSELDKNRSAALCRIMQKLPQIALDNGCKNGYRLVVNQGDDAGQTVFHLHIHILGGENLPWE